MDDLKELLAEATPGPWTLETHHKQGIDRLVPVWYVSGANKVGIAVQPSYSSPDHEASNARLIAMAPDLAAEVLRLREALAKVNGITESSLPATVTLNVADIQKIARAALEKEKPNG